MQKGIRFFTENILRVQTLTCSVSLLQALLEIKKRPDGYAPSRDLYPAAPNSVSHFLRSAESGGEGTLEFDGTI